MACTFLSPRCEMALGSMSFIAPFVTLASGNSACSSQSYDQAQVCVLSSANRVDRSVYQLRRNDVFHGCLSRSTRKFLHLECLPSFSYDTRRDLRITAAVEGKEEASSATPGSTEPARWPKQETIYVNEKSAYIGELSRKGSEAVKGGQFIEVQHGGRTAAQGDGPLKWFYREVESRVPNSAELPVVLLHGLPSQSYSYRDVLPALAGAGYRVLALDWIGFGFSDKPQPGYGFDYTPESYELALGEVLEALGLDKFHLVVQGFLGGPVGLKYALANPDKIDRLAILNAPLGPTAAKLPGKLAPMKLPIVGEFISQNVIGVEQTLEGGGPYMIPEEDCDVYRRPYQISANAGFALLETVRKMNLKKELEDVERGFAAWDKPTCIIWGANDRYVPFDSVARFQAVCPRAELSLIDGECGHYPQEDWHDKVSAALVQFLRRTR